MAHTCTCSSTRIRVLLLTFYVRSPSLSFAILLHPPILPPVAAAAKPHCTGPTAPDKLREITERLKVNLAKIKKITQAEGRAGTDSAAVKSTSASSGKDGKGSGEGGAGEEGGSWRDAGGILGDMKEGINVNLKDVKVPEFDVRRGVFRRTGRGSGGGGGRRRVG